MAKIFQNVIITNSHIQEVQLNPSRINNKIIIIINLMKTSNKEIYLKFLREETHYIKKKMIKVITEFGGKCNFSEKTTDDILKVLKNLPT